ncbi:MAG: AAA family ATPase, partial [Desulfurococcales archaeon]|nr:AAA family ATPase [Desulfurococcales archaeon]
MPEGEAAIGGYSGKHSVYVSIERFRVKNFKSLEDVKLEVLPGVNLLVGPNASGKSNLLEAIAFLRKALVDAAGRTPYMPHVPWYWEALDVIYRRDLRKPVTLELGGTLYARLCNGDYGRADFHFEVTMMYDQASATLKPRIYRLVLGGLKITLSPEGVVTEVPASYLEEAKDLADTRLYSKARDLYALKGDVAVAKVGWRVPPPDPLLPSLLTPVWQLTPLRRVRGCLA